MEMIETDNLSRIFMPENIHAIDCLSLKVKVGTIFALLGPNGAGKTTTVRVLSTLLQPTDGIAYIDNISVNEQPIEIRKKIGILTDQLNLYERLSARKNLTYFARMYNTPLEIAKKRIDELATQFELKDRLDDPVSSFSKGMKLKLGLLRTMIHNPLVLFLDEPTSALDPIAAKKIREIIIQLAKDFSVTIFLTTHNLVEADLVADLIGVINKGKLIALGTSQELKEKLSQVNQVVIRLTKDSHIDSATISAIHGVTKAMVHNTELVLDVNNYEQTVPVVVESLIHNHSRILEVRRQEHTLEEVYLSLMDSKKGN